MNSKADVCRCNYAKQSSVSHAADCPLATRSDLLIHARRLALLLKGTREQLDAGHRWITALQGKVAVLRHENNKLRRANRRLREEES